MKKLLSELNVGDVFIYEDLEYEKGTPTPLSDYFCYHEGKECMFGGWVEVNVTEKKLTIEDRICLLEEKIEKMKVHIKKQDLLIENLRKHYN